HLHHRLTQVFGADVLVVLGVQHYRLDGLGAVALVSHGYLGLAVGAQPGQLAALAYFRLAGGQPTHILDGHEHPPPGHVGGIAVHQALVAGALVQVQAGAFVDPLGDLRRLAVEGDQHGTVLAVEAHAAIVVADVEDGLADDVGVVDHGIGGDLAGDHRHAGVDHDLTGHAGLGVLRQDGVEDGIGTVVGDLVGMAFAHGFGRYEIAARHNSNLIHIVGYVRTGVLDA